MQREGNSGICYEIAVVGGVVDASNEPNVAAHPAHWPLLPGDHHRRDSDEVGASICEDHKQLMGSAKRIPPANIPRKCLEYAVARRAIQESRPCSFQIGDIVPVLDSSRANPGRVKCQRRSLPFLLFRNSDAVGAKSTAGIQQSLR